MSIVGFFTLLAIAISLRLIGNRLAPVVMPTGRLKTITLGWAGSFFGSWLDNVWWQIGPKVAEINLMAAVIGCALFIILLGIYPFIKILLGKV